MFSNNKIPMKAYTWDGKTKYKINETEEEEKERLANWDKFLAEEAAEKDQEDKKWVYSEWKLVLYFLDRILSGF